MPKLVSAPLPCVDRVGMSGPVRTQSPTLGAGCVDASKATHGGSSKVGDTSRGGACAWPIAYTEACCSACMGAACMGAPTPGLAGGATLPTYGVFSRRRGVGCALPGRAASDPFRMGDAALGTAPMRPPGAAAAKPPGGAAGKKPSIVCGRYST
eukprot:365717-Chlamydomonas_euryale.AAC.5